MKVHDPNEIIIIDDIPEVHLSYKSKNFFMNFFINFFLENVIPIKCWNGEDLRDDSLHKIKNILQASRGNFDIDEIVYSCMLSEV